MSAGSGDVLVFFSRSANAAPGRGAGEHVNDVNLYRDLYGIQDWRRMLSNFYISPFHWNGYRYNTAEHAYQATKLSFANPTSAYQLTMESGSPISLAEGVEARNMRKMAILNNEQLARWESIRDGVMLSILEAKYRSNPTLVHVLLSTRNAELWHHQQRQGKVREYQLERVRELLRNEARA